LVKLFAQIEPVLRSNERHIVTAAAVETAPTTGLDAAPQGANFTATSVPFLAALYS
jgi:hypothetical protein